MPHNMTETQRETQFLIDPQRLVWRRQHVIIMIEITQNRYEWLEMVPLYINMNHKRNGQP